MKIEILGAESFGVRSMCCLVRTRSNRYLIDPGVSLAPRRCKLPPHPAEIEAAAEVSSRINRAAESAEAVIITHFHHDHFTPFYEHEYSRVDRSIYAGKKIFIKSYLERINPNQRMRARRFVKGLPDDRELQLSDGKEFGDLKFSPAFPHGEKGRGIFVVMVAVKSSGSVFVHGSDIQSVQEEAVDWIIGQKPQAAFVSGPPIYIPEFASGPRERARENIKRMAVHIPLLIIDHHLLRSLEYVSYLAEALDIAGKAGHRLVVASEHMGRKPKLLEARRDALHRGGDGSRGLSVS